MSRLPSRANGAWRGNGGTPPPEGPPPEGQLAGEPAQEHGEAGAALSGETLGVRPEARFRYHRESFRRSLIIAIALTGLVCGLVWLLLGIYGVRQMNWITAITGLVFFAFISARMLANYLRGDIILAVQPTGLMDRRIAAEPLAWEAIKELVLIRREQEFTLRIIMWPQAGGGGRSGKVHEVDLSGLEGGTRPVIEAISAYKPVRMER